jgi:membrane-associated phospholipid phosphatase
MKKSGWGAWRARSSLLIFVNRAKWQQESAWASCFAVPYLRLVNPVRLALEAWMGGGRVTLTLNDYRRALLVAAAAALALMLALPPLLAFRVDYASFLPLYVMVALPAAVIPYAKWRGLLPLVPVLEATSLGLLLTLPVLVFTYGAMRLDMPLADPLLARMDAAIGFDWTGFVRLVDTSRAAAFVLAIGYSSFSFQLLLLPTLLCIARRPERAYMLMIAYVILCTLSAAFGAFFPSVGAYVTHGLDPHSLHHVSGKFGHFFLDSFHAVRDEPAFTLSIANVAGVLTFPSVHAGVAGLCAWAAWPARWLRWPFLILNLVMATSAISHGAHYLVDIAAGFCVAAVTVRLVDMLAKVLRNATSKSLAPALAA